MSEILKNRHILVVEDEEVNWFLVRDILQIYQVNTTWAEVGIKAVDLIKEGVFFDIILMDINLPGIDGLETTRRILQLQPQIPIIAQTAFALNEEIDLCYKAGCIGHICKPFTIKELIRAIENVLSNQT